MISQQPCREGGFGRVRRYRQVHAGPRAARQMKSKKEHRYVIKVMKLNSMKLNDQNKEFLNGSVADTKLIDMNNPILNGSLGVRDPRLPPNMDSTLGTKRDYDDRHTFLLASTKISPQLTTARPYTNNPVQISAMTIIDESSAPDHPRQRPIDVLWNARADRPADALQKLSRDTLTARHGLDREAFLELERLRLTREAYRGDPSTAHTRFYDYEYQHGKRASN